MTATVPTPTRPPALSRRATLGAAGGVLWALLPVAWLVSDVRDLERGTLSSVAVLASFWLAAVAGPALIVVGHTALRSALGAAGRTGSVGIGSAGVGFSAVALGNGIELASLSAGGGTSVVGYVVFYVGFLVAFVGSLLIGVTLLRRRPGSAIRPAAWLLVLAIPLGIGIGMLFALVAPNHEAGFFAAVALPTGVAWALLGRSLAAGREGSPASG